MGESEVASVLEIDGCDGRGVGSAEPHPWRSANLVCTDRWTLTNGLQRRRSDIGTIRESASRLESCGECPRLGARNLVPSVQWRCSYADAEADREPRFESRNLPPRVASRIAFRPRQHRVSGDGFAGFLHRKEISNCNPSQCSGVRDNVDAKMTKVNVDPRAFAQNHANCTNRRELV